MSASIILTIDGEGELNIKADLSKAASGERTVAGKMIELFLRDAQIPEKDLDIKFVDKSE